MVRKIELYSVRYKMTGPEKESLMGQTNVRATTSKRAGEQVKRREMPFYRKWGYTRCTILGVRSALQKRGT